MLDFTDLVFVDPVGTGCSSFLPPMEEDGKKRLWSVGGDIDALSQAIRRWLDKSGRIASTKYLLGESYGGFRAPRLARRLAGHDGVGLRGLVMISPVLDFGNHSGALDLLGYALRLPSMAAAVRSEKGEPFSTADLADVVDYATGAFLTDVLRGYADPIAADHVVGRVTAITGLDPALVRRRRGLISGYRFEHDRATGRIARAYHATVALPDAYPERSDVDQPDAELGALEAPLSEAALWVYDRLHWHPEGQTYQLVASEAGRNWDFGRGRVAPELNRRFTTVYSLSRHPTASPTGSVVTGKIDVGDEASIAAAAGAIDGSLDLVIIATGILHEDTRAPERSLRELDASWLARVFAINTIGPALVVRHFTPLLPRIGRSVLAALSARVGSVSDNRAGGWYGYRASKAALNMIIRSAAIELARSRPEAICVALHPRNRHQRPQSPFPDPRFGRKTVRAVRGGGPIARRARPDHARSKRAMFRLGRCGDRALRRTPASGQGGDVSPGRGSKRGAVGTSL